MLNPISGHARIKINTPMEGAILKTNEVKIDFEVDNWEIGEGNHLHLQLDRGCATASASGLACINIDQPGTSMDGDQIAHRSRDPITLIDVPNGKYDIQIFLVEADHISIGAVDKITITVDGTLSTSSTTTSSSGGGY